MSTKTQEILNQLKSLTLLEAAELVSHIEESFGVIVTARQPCQANLCLQPYTFDVVLEAVTLGKKISVIKILCILNKLALWEAQAFLESLPQVVVTTFHINTAKDIQLQLTAAGAIASLRKS